MEKSKQAMSLYEDQVRGMLLKHLPTLTDEQHAKVASVVIDLILPYHIGEAVSRIGGVMISGSVESVSVLPDGNYGTSFRNVRYKDDHQ